jgi:DnaJ-domain-containing protein 1
LLDAMDLDDRAGAPVFEALTSLAVSADETARAAQILSSVANQYRERLADVNPDASLTESETRRIERLALIAQARASLTKALVESQFRRVEDERHV